MQPKKITSDIEKRIEEVMAKLNIPTKDEIDALGAKITALTKKVDELKKSEPETRVTAIATARGGGSLFSLPFRSVPRFGPMGFWGTIDRCL